MKHAERCIPWRPVPPPWDRYMVLNVARLEQDGLTEGLPVAVTVVASDEEQRADPVNIIVRSWRITFQHVAGYRWRPIDQPLDRPRIAFPGHWHEGGDIATWEVAHSQWLPEAIGTLYSHPKAVHHYVIASSYEIYDFAAERWTVEALAEQRSRE